MDRLGQGTLVTDRLIIRRLNLGDRAFIVDLLNQPSFLQYIGDRGVRDEQGAVAYLEKGPLDSYQRHGFGLFMVEHRGTGDGLGICGLLKRPELDDVDLGFAFLPEFWSKGYAGESSRAVLDWGRDALGLARIVAITSLKNASSMRLLEKLGFVLEGETRLGNSTETVNLFAIELHNDPSGAEPGAGV